MTFLDKTNLLGYDGQDMAKLGRYSVETRLGMITHCNSANFNDVDGIIGFGWANQNRSAAILKTLTQDGRPHWDIKRKPSPDLRSRTLGPPRDGARARASPRCARNAARPAFRECAWPCVLAVTVRPLPCNRAPGVHADAAQVRVHGV